MEGSAGVGARRRAWQSSPVLGTGSVTRPGSAAAKVAATTDAKQDLLGDGPPDDSATDRVTSIPVVAAFAATRSIRPAQDPAPSAGLNCPVRLRARRPIRRGRRVHPVVEPSEKLARMSPDPSLDASKKPPVVMRVSWAAELRGGCAGGAGEGSRWQAARRHGTWRGAMRSHRNRSVPSIPPRQGRKNVPRDETSIHVRPPVRVFLGEGAPMDPVLPFPSSAPLGRNDFVVLVTGVAPPAPGPSDPDARNSSPQPLAEPLLSQRIGQRKPD
jgi:hypothetical protein